MFDVVFLKTEGTNIFPLMDVQGSEEIQVAPIYHLSKNNILLLLLLLLCACLC